MVDHDRLFKQLLSTFFLEFLEKETFTDVVAGQHHVVDLLVRVRVRGMPRCVLVHVENQADANAIAEFPRRMFRYFAGLEARHGVPIYPVAVLSFERPLRRRADRYEMSLPGLSVLRFRFRQVQLNRLPGRAYVRRPNPVAAALMSRMRIGRAERPRVKLECLRLLATLRLDPAKSRLISSFIDTYLNLRGRERRLFARELKAMPADERENVMELTTSWKEEGRLQEAAQLVLRLLRRRIGGVSDVQARRIEALPLEQVESLGEDLLDFTAVSDLDHWLQSHPSRT